MPGGRQMTQRDTLAFSDNDEKHWDELTSRFRIFDLSQILNKYSQTSIGGNGSLCISQNYFLLIENRCNFSVHCFVPPQ
jgi:hypothetical protein